MNKGRRYYRTEDLKPYTIIGEHIIIPTGMTFEQSYHVLSEIGNEDHIIMVFYGIDMNTTRDWATTEKMAIANKIKLLENQIVMLEQRL